MKKRILSLILALCLIFSLSSCFPNANNKYIADTDGHNRISMREINSQTRHIEEIVSDDFSINADVYIEVVGGFNTYKAKATTVDFDQWSRLFIKDEDVKETHQEEDTGFQNKITKDGSVSAKDVSIFKQSFFNYFSKKDYVDRDLSLASQAYLEKNAKIDYPYGTLKELDFMSSDDAITLMDNTLTAMGIETYDYYIYSVDYEFLQKHKAFSIDFMNGVDDIADPTKDDEFYIVIPRLAPLPDYSIQARVRYQLEGERVGITSNQTVALIGKNGIINFSCYGTFDKITEVHTEVDEIVDVESAWASLKEIFANADLPQPLAVEKIELAYVPYILDREQGIFEFKPTWIFRMIKAGTNRYDELVDAVTGEVVKINRD